MLQRPVHKSTSKSCCRKNVGQQDSFFCKTQVNNKTAAESFSQNQPVAARGINNNNFHTATAMQGGRQAEVSRRGVGRVVPTARTPRGRVQSAGYPTGPTDVKGGRQTQPPAPHPSPHARRPRVRYELVVESESVPTPG